MRKFYRILCIVLALALLLLPVAGCGQKQQPAAGDGPVKVTVVLDWFPNTNHTGLYAALDKGWFLEEGLAVEIIQPPETGAAQLVAAGKAEFGVSYQEEITLARSAGIPLVSIAAVIQHNTSAFASRRELGITRPRDFEGRRYGGWGSPIEEAVIKTMMINDGGDFSRVEFVDIGAADFFVGMERDFDFAWIFEGWDGVQAGLIGRELSLVRLRDFHPALDYYTPVLATSESIIAGKPELAASFMRAAARGYQFAIASPQEAAQILLKHVPELDVALVAASQRWLSDKYQAGAARWGLQKEEVWERYAAWLYENGQLPAMIDVKQAFTNSFLAD
jgi:ABC-type nitrate/sulfonate/bicarbonate transport system substrate-binding protein